MDTGEYVSPSEMPFITWRDKWLDVYKSTSLRPKSLATQRNSLKRLSAEFSRKPLSAITPADIQGEINRMISGGLARQSAHLSRATLITCLQRAVDDGMIRRNPARATDPVRRATSPVDRALTIEQENTLLQMLTAPQGKGKPGAAEKSIRDALLMCLCIGLRASEPGTIKRSDVFDGSVRVHGTKTADADRVVPLPPVVSEMIARRLETTSTIYLFAMENGHPLKGSQLYSFLHTRTSHSVHSLRHTFCTRGAQAGVNPKILQTITGHKDLRTLLDIYTHAGETDKQSAMQKITAYCKPTANQGVKEEK